MTASTAPLSYGIEAAAERLGAAVTPDWLRKHLHEIPHTRSGKGRGRAGRVAFTEAHLVEILQMIEQRPASMPSPADPDDFADAIVSRGSRSTKTTADRDGASARVGGLHGQRSNTSPTTRSTRPGANRSSAQPGRDNAASSASPATSTTT